MNGAVALVTQVPLEDEPFQVLAAVGALDRVEERVQFQVVIGAREIVRLNIVAKNVGCVKKNVHSNKIILTEPP